MIEIRSSIISVSGNCMLMPINAKEKVSKKESFCEKKHFETMRIVIIVKYQFLVD